MNANQPDAVAPVLSLSLLARMDLAGPRYTSYPTADRFVETFTVEDYLSALRKRSEGQAAAGGNPLSIYVHIPFCESVCYYCACNKVVTKHHDRAAPYLDALEREIALHVDVLGKGQAVSQLHFGGGTPTFLSDAELGRLMDALRRAFTLRADAEMSIEVDPRTVTRERLSKLASFGFNRISFGVQDFDHDVQVAVHRIQPYESVAALVNDARELGFVSINVDLIYGLPKQTSVSFARTIESVVKLRPQRVALYSYAHLPQRFQPQRRIAAADLPPGDERVSMLGGAISSFLEHGYNYIGMDHFALPDDALAVAKRQGMLHRNFQGYSTQADCDLIGLGVSSIGHVGSTYSQNVKTVEAYYAALEQGRLPIARGLNSSDDDVLRRSVIMALMCQGRVEFKAIEKEYGINFREYFGAEMERLAPLVEGDLAKVSQDAIEITPTGWFFVRGVAMVFDKYLQAGRPVERFSRII